MELLGQAANIPARANSFVLDTIWRLITGTDAKDFQWVQGKTPLSSTQSVVISCFSYFLAVMIGQSIMKRMDIKPFKLSFLFTLHNLILTLVSASLLIAIMQQQIPHIYKHGFVWSICDVGVWRQRAILLYYINFLTKMHEWIDTLFLVLRRKKLTILHVWHHAMTALLCFTQLEGETSVQWFVISLNLAVHVMMYYYYFLSSLGYKVWWRQYVTMAQIIQFVIDIGVIGLALTLHYGYHYGIPFRTKQDCRGSETAGMWGAFIITSYLVLFVNFWVQQYIKKPRSGQGKPARKAIESAQDVIGPPKSQDLQKVGNGTGNGQVKKNK